jgi:hypothetical protein
VETKRPKLKGNSSTWSACGRCRKTPLKATITGTIERQGVVIDKLHYQSKPGLHVTGNLYRPGITRQTRKD